MNIPRVHPADGLVLTLIALPVRFAMRHCDTFLGKSYLKPRRTPR